MRKKLNNFKSDVKNKTDLNKTGNKPIKLKEWEVMFQELMSADENPSICCIPGKQNFIQILHIIYFYLQSFHVYICTMNRWFICWNR